MWRLIHVIPVSAEFDDRTDVLIVVIDPKGNVLRHIVYENNLVSALRAAADWFEAKSKGLL
jgi:hypothetical protein